MKKLYLKSALLLVLTVLVGLTSCKKDEFEKLSLSFSSSSVDIDENGYIGLKKYLVIQPSNLDTITVAWSSSDESVATVSKNGSVEGISSGTAIITASAYGKSATIKVNVTSLPIEGVTIPKTVNNIWVNVPYKLDGVGLTPSGASLKRINWSDESGKLTFEYNEEENAWYVTATEAGTYNVKATADDHEAESTFTVKIKTIDSITLSETSLSLLSTGTESRTATLTYKIKPADASYQEVEWSATPSGIINLDKGKITTIDGKEGTVTVTLKHKAKATGDKDIEATCKVVVTKTVAVESFTLSESEVTFDIGKTYTLKVKDFKPANGDVSKIHWESDDWNVVNLNVAVGSSCTLEGLGTQTKTVYVTATAPNGYAQKVKVTVKKVPSTLTWSLPDNIFFFPGKSYNLPFAEVNKDATIKSVKYAVYTSDGYSASNYMDVDALSSKLKITVKSLPTNYDYKEFRIEADCDGDKLSRKITVFKSDILSESISVSSELKNIYGTYKTHFWIIPSLYLRHNDVFNIIKDSVYTSTSALAGGNYVLANKSDYDSNKDYKEMTFYFDDLGESQKEEDNITINFYLYDYARNRQKADIKFYLYYSFLGYYYRANGKSGNIKMGDPVTVNYVKQADNKYLAPAVDFYQIYYSDANKTKVMDLSGSISEKTYTTKVERSELFYIRDNEPLAIVYK